MSNDTNTPTTITTDEMIEHNMNMLIQTMKERGLHLFADISGYWEEFDPRDLYEPWNHDDFGFIEELGKMISNCQHGNIVSHHFAFLRL